MRSSALMLVVTLLAGAAGTDGRALSAQGQIPRGDIESTAPSEMTASTPSHPTVTDRRRRVVVICHRGASEFAHENTLEAYRATFELGGDGNEIDIRSTKDHVLVCFHDDWLDERLEAFGAVEDYTWDALQRFRFRDPGEFGEQCRIPTLVEVLDLHRQYGGLLHLDIKRPGLDQEIADLLTRMTMWEHVGFCNDANAEVILGDPRLKLLRYKAPGMYQDHGELFPEAIANALQKPGDGLIVDDPRGVAVALGRRLGPLSTTAVSPRPEILRTAGPTPLPVSELIAILQDADDWDRVEETPQHRAVARRRLRARAEAAEQLRRANASSPAAHAALEQRVRQRSLDKDWRYHGLDGAIALRSLLLLHAPNAVDLARFALWRDDPALEPLVDPRWQTPRAWVDFRVKMVVFPALEKCPGRDTETLCRDYLALDEESARQLGPTMFEEAARALLVVSPNTETALELMKHRLPVVRGRAILECLSHCQEPWALTALEQVAPFALNYRVVTQKK